MKKRGGIKTTGFLMIMVLSVLLLATGADAKNKRYGIFVGINDYPGEQNDLYGAVNDAENMRDLLITKFKFPRANTTVLLDDQATRDGILGQIKAYGKLVGPGDELVFQYSGHGSLWPDLYSEVVDETVKTEVDYYDSDGNRHHIPLNYYDSAIVPWDFESSSSGKGWDNMILDDELYALFAGLTKKGVTVVFVSDSCHSGTVGKAELTKARIKFMPVEKMFNVKNMTDVSFEKPKNQVKAGPVAFDPYYITLTAAKDNEFALDDSNGSVPGGLFTETLITIVKSSKTPLTYRRLIALVQPRVANESSKQSNDQHPQIDPRFGKADTMLFEPVVGTRQRKGK
jgi:hypothetical protein